MTWASGGVFADFSNNAGRGFVAPPDVSLAAPPRAAPWLNIALGTAAPGYPAANNRFYVLRDYTPFAARTDAQYRDWQPLHETDLLRVATAGLPPQEEVVAGWFIELGTGEVITAAVTVAGQHHTGHRGINHRRRHGMPVCVQHRDLADRANGNFAAGRIRQLAPAAACGARIRRGLHHRDGCRRRGPNPRQVCAG